MRIKFLSEDWYSFTYLAADWKMVLRFFLRSCCCVSSSESCAICTPDKEKRSKTNLLAGSLLLRTILSGLLGGSLLLEDGLRHRCGGGSGFGGHGNGFCGRQVILLCGRQTALF